MALAELSPSESFIEFADSVVCSCESRIFSVNFIASLQMTHMLEKVEDEPPDLQYYRDMYKLQWEPTIELAHRAMAVELIAVAYDKVFIEYAEEKRHAQISSTVITATDDDGVQVVETSESSSSMIANIPSSPNSDSSIETVLDNDVQSMGGSKTLHLTSGHGHLRKG